MSYVILASSVLLADKLRDYVFFPLYSVLFFGVVSSFYFILPFLFLGRLSFRRALRLLIVWSLSFPLGFVFSNSLVFIAVGHGVEIAGWRHPNPIESWSDLSQNAAQALGEASAHFAALAEHASLLLLPAVAIGVMLSLRHRRWWCLWVAASCAVALYITSLAVGVVVSVRTAGVAWAALLLGAFLVERLSRVEQGVMAIPIAFLSASLALSSLGYTRWYVAVTNGLLQEADTLLSGFAPSSKVVVLASRADWQSAIDDIERRSDTSRVLAEPMAAPVYWRALLLSRGFERLSLCPEGVGNPDCLWAQKQLIEGRDRIKLGAYFGTLRADDGRVICVSRSFM